MRFCVFGAGRMGSRHIANIAASERAELAYVVDPDMSRAEPLAARGPNRGQSRRGAVYLDGSAPGPAARSTVERG